jgi:hypothetical protein
LSELRIVQGSCRKPHDAGRDALAELATFLDVTTLPRPAAEYPVDVIPQMLFMTGDQIYADDVALPLLLQLNEIGNQIIGGSPEQIPVFIDNANGKGTRPATLEAFPVGQRRALVKGRDANLTSADDVSHSHLLSFGEFCAMYLMTLSNVLWPAADAHPDPTVVNAPLPSDAQALAIKIDLEKTELEERTESENDARRALYCEHLRALKRFAVSLGEVRQALANIATYMILDDHEVTDDLFLTLKWKKDVLGSPTGLHLTRNGMVAYAFFQGWGNDPAAFATGGVNAGFLEQAATAITGRNPADITTLDAALGLSTPFSPTVQWSYQLLDDSWAFGVLVFDERTRRGYRSDISPPARIAPVQMSPTQIPNPIARAGRDVLFVVTPCPVLGLPLIEELIQPGVSRVLNFTQVITSHSPSGQADVDQDAWSHDPAALELMLSLLAPARRIVFVSGDVHFAHAATMTYWPLTATSPSRFIQFTSSALNNSAEQYLLDLIHTFGLAQRLLRFGSSAARLGWLENEPTPLTFPGDAPLASYPPEVRSRFLVAPVLLPAQRWPAGVGFQRNPDFVWSLKFVFDQRPEEGRLDRPLPPAIPPGPVPLNLFPEVARYHIESMRRRGLSRQTVFAHNIGVISISSPGGVLTATHTAYSPPVASPEIFEPITIHSTPLDVDAAEIKPGLQP